MKAKDTEFTGRLGVSLASAAFLKLGFAFREQTESDYGIDAHVELIEAEKPTGQLLGVQLKSGPSYFSECIESSIVYRSDTEHIDYWLNHSLPVIICLCDTKNEVIYWQAVTKETATSTGKAYKIAIPVSQALNATSRPNLSAMLTPRVSPDRYTIFKTGDVSHGLAKRYSFNIVVNGTASKAEVASIIRQVTIVGMQRRYYRNHMVEGRWGDTDAHVVWTYVFPSAEDEARGNPICRGQWIDPLLKTSARPTAFEGENIGGNIILSWNTEYDFLAKHTSENTLTKEDYLATVVPLIEELEICSNQMITSLNFLKNQEISETLFRAQTLDVRTRVDDIYWQISKLLLAPYECQEMDGRLDCYLANLHNIVLSYSEKGLNTWDESNRLYMSLQQHKDAQEHFVELKYEMKKIK